MDRTSVGPLRKTRKEAVADTPALSCRLRGLTATYRQQHPDMEDA